MNLDEVKAKFEIEKKYLRQLTDNAEHAAIKIDVNELKHEICGDLVAPHSIAKYKYHVANTYSDIMIKRATLERVYGEYIDLLTTLMRENAILSAREKERKNIDEVKRDSSTNKKRLTLQFRQDMQKLELTKKFRQIGVGPADILQFMNLPNESENVEDAMFNFNLRDSGHQHDD